MILAALLLSTTILTGWTVDTGEPIYYTMLTMDEVKASPEFATLMRNRNAHALAELRAERVAEARTVNPIALGPTADPGPAAGEVEATGTQPTDSSVPPSPGLILWRPDVERWRGLVAEFFYPSEVDHALAIVRCESLGDQDATNPSSGTAGLFQHRPRYWLERSALAGWAGADIYDPRANTAVAAWLVHTEGWFHFACEWYAVEQGVSHP